MDATELESRLDSRLMTRGLYLTSFARDEDGLHLAYETTAPGDGVPHREVGKVLTLLRDAREEGWTVETVHGTVCDLDGETRGTWRAEGDWLRALVEEDISEVEFSGRVLDTIEETPPRSGT